MFQPSLEDLGQPLIDTTFVVVDLETTGGSPTSDRITEVGAVKIRGGEVIGELSTLVDPGIAVPASITALTGISSALVTGRPSVASVLPSFLEFARGAALVAHNARFDTGFLNAALQRLSYPPLDHPVLCTAQLARRLVDDEVGNRRLGTLARHFRSTTVPIHRALADARATVDVFHGLLEAAGTHGVVTLEDLIAFARVRNMPLFTSRRKMADGLPRRPGVYRFISASGEVLYVGKATDLRARVRQYFGTDTRPRMRQLVAEAVRIDHTPTPTAIEAEILESRLIRQHRPRFNAKGKRVSVPVWVVLTAGAFPRLSVVRRPPAAGRTALGPLPSSRIAHEVIEALHDALPIRRCATGMNADTRFAACALAEMGRCVAPCTGASTPAEYGRVVDDVAQALDGDATTAVRMLQDRMAARARDGRYEEAAATRDRIAALLMWTTRMGRDRALRAAGLVAASRPIDVGRREVLVQRSGWLVGTDVVAPDQVTASWSRLAGSAADAGASPPPPPEELLVLQRWLASDGVRIEHADQPLAWPVGGGAASDRTQAQITGARSRTGRPESYLATKRLSRAPS